MRLLRYFNLIRYVLTKFIKTIILAGVIACIFSCHRYSDGTYIVYKIEPSENSQTQPMGYSDSLYNVMKSSLSASKYHITFNDRFATIRSLKRNTEAILSKSEDKDYGEIYSSEEKQGITKITNTIRFNKAGDMLCIVELERPLLPGESPDDFGIIKFREKRAQAICYLSQVKE